MSRKRSALPEEIFLSYSSDDARFTRRLGRELARHGIESFISQKNIIGAQQWHDEIGAALNRCRWFVVVLSPGSVRSRWVKHELVSALQSRRYRNRIVPVLYRTCKPAKLSWTLAAFQRIDFRKGFEQGLRELLAVWNVEYRKAGARK